jgi:predicted small secreted protein
MKTRLIAVVAIVGLSAFALAGCSTEARAERKGKSAGDQICKVKDADNANDAQRHLRKANDKLDDLARFTGRDVREDLRDIDRNLDQMGRGNATDQDVNAIVRSVQSAASSLNGNAAAAYDGMLEALANCD